MDTLNKVLRAAQILHAEYGLDVGGVIGAPGARVVALRVPHTREVLRFPFENESADAEEMARLVAVDVHAHHSVTKWAGRLREGRAGRARYCTVCLTLFPAAGPRAHHRHREPTLAGATLREGARR